MYVFTVILGVWSIIVANRPGHQAMVGSLIPPSNVVSLPQRNGPFVPPADTHTQNRYAMKYKSMYSKCHMHMENTLATA